MRLSLSLSLALMGLAFGCSSSLETFRCEANADCTSVDQSGGVCESTQVCSFADPECTGSGQRYGPASGEQSNACVGATEGSADASTSNERIDAGPGASDGSVGVPDADPTVPDGAPSPDAELSCDTLLTITVHDDHEANDYLRVRENGDVVFECHPEEGPGDGDVVANCVYCMTGGVSVELKGVTSAHVTSSSSDCDPICVNSNDDKCTFQATTSCSMVVYFDTDIPAP